MKKSIKTENAPQPVGRYSQAVQVGSTLYLAGQVGLSPQTGQLVEGGLPAETHQAIRNVEAVLKAAELSLDNVVSIVAYLSDSSYFAAFNEIFASYGWGDVPPARTTVIVKALPLGAAVELTATAADN